MNKIIIFLITSLFFSLSYANPASESLTRALNNTHSMQADFNQFMVTNKQKTMQKTQGRMSLQRPGNFRWEVLQPIHQIIIANGKRLWIYDVDLEQVTVRTLSAAAGQTPALLLTTTSASLEEDFQIEQLPNKNNVEWFSLIPKDKKSSFEKMLLGFANNQVHEMRLEDRLGQTTVIQFKNIKTNVTLPAKLFSFKPPAHIDVIDETRPR